MGYNNNEILGGEMSIDLFLETFREYKDRRAIIWNNVPFTYDDLLKKINCYQIHLHTNNIISGMVVGLQGDFSPGSIALMIALIGNANIIVPLTSTTPSGVLKKCEIAQVEFMLTLDECDNLSTFSTSRTAEHDYYSTIRDSGESGLVLFSSGTSGEPKAAVHRFTKLLEKYKTKRATLKTVNFLLFDHWGGLNTLFHTLSNAGVVLTIKDRLPDAVCHFIEKHSIELLPASPTFLNLLLISEAYKKYDLSSLKVISYGTEPMTGSTLTRLNKLFPDIRIQQTYGLIELGVLRAKSKSNDSLWVKVGGEGYELRVRDGILEIKADSAMLGYLNAVSPFTDDGFFITGDAVEVDGDYFKILGRKSELINVGGDKVYPAEVESVIRTIENVADVLVYGEKNMITGNIVCAKLNIITCEGQKECANRIKKECRGKLEEYKIPVKIKITTEPLYGERLKLIRNSY